MAEWLRALRLVAESPVTWVWFLHGAETSAAPLPFCVALSPSVHWHASFLYCCALYIFFFLDFVSGDLALTELNLNTTIRLPLFWRNGAWARTRPHVLAWHKGRDYSDCRASELTDRQVSGFVFSWFHENTVTEKTKALQETFLRLMTQTAYCPSLCKN